MSSLPVVELRSPELFDAYERQQRPFLARMEGRPDLTVVPASQASEDTLSETDVASLRRGADEMARGEGRPARDLLSDMRARYGL